MSGLARLAAGIYRGLLSLYPARFRAEFGEEMQAVFAEAAYEAGSTPGKLLALFGREVRDLPGAVWRAHLRRRKGNIMNQNNLAWKPPTTKELLIGLALFVLPIFANFLKLISVTNYFGSALAIALLITILIILAYGLKQGFPRWVVPYLGIAVTSIVILGFSTRIWDLFYLDVQRAIGYYTKTLQVRVLYQALMWGFFWFLAFAALVLLILLLAAWPRTRKLAQRIRQDWTLLSFMLYGGVVFAIVLVFDEYRYDEPWMIACLACLAAGAWMYFRSGTPRKRILALLGGVTLAYWIAATGKFYLVPLQTWGAFHGYDYETYSRFEFWRTLAEWGWVALFMLTPALLTLIPHSRESGPAPEENLAAT